MAVPDWSDPCARATALRNAYFALVSGQGTARIRFSDREVEFQRTRLDVLKAELTEAEALCARKCDPYRPRRFAIGSGMRPHIRRFPWRIF